MDTALKKLFRTKLRLGIYDAQPCNPYDNVTEKDINSEENREICRQLTRESIVLLKNRDHFLPLDKTSADSTALIGPFGDAWYQDWYGGKAYSETTLYDGLRKVIGASGSTNGMPYADGLDRIVFRCGEKGIAVLPDGSAYLAEEPDVFIKENCLLPSSL